MVFRVGFLFLFGIFLLLYGCGGSSDNSSVSGGSRVLLGGSVQGKSVSAPSMVSTVAGVSGAADGTGSAAAFNDPCHVTSDGTNLYVTDQYNHTVRRVEIATGAVTTIAGSPGLAGNVDGIGAAARFYDPVGITTDGTNLYVTDYDWHVIRKIVIATGQVTTIAGSVGTAGSADGVGSAARFKNPRNVCLVGSNLYVADGGNNTIRRIDVTSNTVSTFAGTAGITGAADGTGATASFNVPGSMVSDGSNLYLTDFANNTIRKIVLASAQVSTLAGAAGVQGFANGTGTAATFSGPSGITSDGSSLYVADYGNSSIRKVEIATGVVTTQAGTGTVGFSDGTAGAATFCRPTGITLSGSSLFVVDNGNSVIRRVDLAAGSVSTLAGTAASTDGTASAARFYSPTGVTTDGTSLFVAEQNNHTIRKVIIATGAVTTVAGYPGLVGNADGTGSGARFTYPDGITTDGTNLYVTDYGANTVRQVVIATGAVSTLAGIPETAGSADGVGTAATFSGPRGITTDGTSLYVVDGHNNTIRKIVISTGTVSTVAGTAGVSGSLDGVGAAASFNFPWGITTDGVNLYVADESNCTIRKIALSSGAVTTIAGMAGSAVSTDGVGTAARFSYPLGITTDGASLYITDAGSNKVRQMSLATGAVTTIAGSGMVGAADGIPAAASFNGAWGITTDGTSLFVVDMRNNTIRRVGI